MAYPIKYKSMHEHNAYTQNLVCYECYVHTIRSVLIKALIELLLQVFAHSSGELSVQLKDI